METAHQNMPAHGSRWMRRLALVGVVLMLNSITRHLILLPMLALVLVVIVAVVKAVLR